MKELAEVIVKALVDHPEEVCVTETESADGNVIKLQIQVADGDAGKVIGKQGRIAKAIRSVMRAVVARENKRVIVDIL